MNYEQKSAWTVVGIAIGIVAAILSMPGCATSRQPGTIRAVFIPHNFEAQEPVILVRPIVNPNDGGL